MCEKEKESDLENVEANGGVGVPHGSDQQLVQHLVDQYRVTSRKK